MTNRYPQLQLRDVSVAGVKSLAQRIKRFLRGHALPISHAQALDLLSILAGYPGWHAYQPVVATTEARHAHQPIRQSYEEWAETFDPERNPLVSAASADGCAFETYGAELAYVTKTHASAPGRVWTVVEAEGRLYLVDGMHFVNRVFYLVTKRSRTSARPFEVPFDHDLGDWHWQLQVIDDDRACVVFEQQDTHPGTEVRTMLEAWRADIDQAKAQIRAGGGTPVVLVTALPCDRAGC